MKSKFIYLAIMAFILLIDVPGWVRADTLVEDVEETSQGKIVEEEEAPSSGKRRSKLTDEEKKEKRRLKQEKTRKLESCLVMTRSYYSKH